MTVPSGRSRSVSFGSKPQERAQGIDVLAPRPDNVSGGSAEELSLMAPKALPPFFSYLDS